MRKENKPVELVEEPVLDSTVSVEETDQSKKKKGNKMQILEEIVDLLGDIFGLLADIVRK